MTSEFSHSLSHIKHEYLENGGISLQKMSLIFIMINPLRQKAYRGCCDPFGPLTVRFSCVQLAVPYINIIKSVNAKIKMKLTYSL